MPPYIFSETDSEMIQMGLESQELLCEKQMILIS